MMMMIIIIIIITTIIRVRGLFILSSVQKAVRRYPFHASRFPTETITSDTAKSF
jgi:hypothetical protein